MEYHDAPELIGDAPPAEPCAQSAEGHAVKSGELDEGMGDAVAAEMETGELDRPSGG
ncbi:MAG: hypothetical protein U0176_14255 [Bacteroidia bacterium]